MIEAAAQAETTRSLAEFNAENVKSLKFLRASERIKIRRFSDELIKTFGKAQQGGARRYRGQGSAEPQGLRQLHGLSRRCHGLWRIVGNRLPRHPSAGENTMTTRRREVLLGGSAIAATTGRLPAPAIAQGIKELKMVTSRSFPLPESTTH